jgi:hypothetical protein
MARYLLLLLALLLIGCSSPAQHPLPTPPNPPLTPDAVYGVTPTTPPKKLADFPPPALTPAPGAVLRVPLSKADLTSEARPGLYLIDPQTGEGELWTVPGSEKAPPGTPLSYAHHLTDDGRFILLQTFAEIGYVVDRNTGEVKRWDDHAYPRMGTAGSRLFLAPREVRDGQAYAIDLTTGQIEIAPVPPYSQPTVKGRSLTLADAEGPIPSMLVMEGERKSHRILNVAPDCGAASLGSTGLDASGEAAWLQTAQGLRLVHFDGTLEEPAFLRAPGNHQPVPSPTVSGLVADVQPAGEQWRLTLFQGGGGALLQLTIRSTGAQDLSVPLWHPSGRWLQWGRTNGGGKGWECFAPPRLPLPPKVQVAPFQPISLVVKGAGDCLNLRAEPQAEGKVTTCLVDGTILHPAAEDDRWQVAGEVAWLKVTAGKAQGWVAASAGFLGWAP